MDWRCRQLQQVLLVPVPRFQIPRRRFSNRFCVLHMIASFVPSNITFASDRRSLSQNGVCNRLQLKMHMSAVWSRSITHCPRNTSAMEQLVEHRLCRNCHAQVVGLLTRASQCCRSAYYGHVLMWRLAHREDGDAELTCQSDYAIEILMFKLKFIAARFTRTSTQMQPCNSRCLTPKVVLKPIASFHSIWLRKESGCDAQRCPTFPIIYL